MTTSKFFLMMRKDGKQCRAHSSSFEKAIGQTITLEGATFYIFSLEPSLHAAQARNAGMGFANNLQLAKRVLPNIFK